MIVVIPYQAGETTVGSISCAYPANEDGSSPCGGSEVWGEDYTKYYVCD